MRLLIAIPVFNERQFVQRVLERVMSFHPGVLLIWAVYTVAVGFLSPDVDNFAHIGGFCGGALVGALLPARAGLFQQHQRFAVTLREPSNG